MIPSLLKFKLRLDTLLTQSFSSNPLFSQSLRESFEFFINRRRDKPAEYIAKYLDHLLKRGDKGLTTDASLEEEMDRALILFRYCHCLMMVSFLVDDFITCLAVPFLL
jgi:cullin 4